MNDLAVHAACLGLVALDFAARTWRTQIFLRGIGHPLSFRDVFVQSAIGETASSLTPMRVGGELVRIWAMGQQGVPARIAIVSVGVELIAVSVIIVLTALVLGVTVAPDWWASAGPGLVRSAVASWPWLAAVAAITGLAWLLMRRLRPDLLDTVRSELSATRGHLGDFPAWVYVANVPLSLLNIGARVAVLPLLASTLDQPPPLAATIVGSFALLYVQAFIPTPAGAGAVELGFLGGAAGERAAGGDLLGWWRFYTTIIGTVLGVVVGIWAFHANVVRLLGRPSLDATETATHEAARDAQRESRDVRSARRARRPGSGRPPDEGAAD